MRRLSVLLALPILLVVATAAPAQSFQYPVGMLGRYTPDGMLVQRVLADSPAAKAGMQPGDLITKVDGRLITSQDEFASVVNSSGGSVVLIVQKAKTGRVIRVGLDLVGGRGGPPAPYFLGVVGHFAPDGMHIRSVAPGTPAARTGLARGDVIGRIDNVPITNQADLFTALYRSGGQVNLLVRKANGRIVRLDADLTIYELGVVGEFGPEGMVVGVVAPDTPATWAGLQRGDCIQRIDNRPVRSQEEFNAAVNNSGGSVTLQVRRGARTTRMQIDLMNNHLGCWCEPSPGGMRLTAVVPGSPAHLAGLVRGDVVVKVDEERVRSQAELLTALRRSRGLVTLAVRKAATGRLETLEIDLLR